MATTIEVEDMITVGTLAERLSIPVTRLIGELMKNGIMATVNERIDFDTAQIIVEELGLEFELKRQVADETVPVREKQAISDKADRPAPVVAVMGHVDHGKTSLLDAIRGADVAKGEAGGITQHISAYQIEHNDRAITFLDTPGHEAFAAIREHGALLTDIVIIVVAADDGIKPQTIEAIRFARKAGVKIIVAANKMDKEGADINRLKQQLSEHELTDRRVGRRHRRAAGICQDRRWYPGTTRHGTAGDRCRRAESRRRRASARSYHRSPRRTGPWPGGARLGRSRYAQAR